MASEEHLKLSEKIKTVHLLLRRRTQEIGPEAAWEEHLTKTETLESYATAMKALAQVHWAQVNQGDRLSMCRIDWITKTIQQYYFHGGCHRELQKEMAKLSFIQEGNSSNTANENVSMPYHSNIYDVGKNLRLKLLDVGSCYNPFKVYDMFHVFPIDLCPADPDVRTCNFLDVTVSETTKEDWFSNPVQVLPSNFFDIVVFCLFLEYLPCPQQRLKACQIAWNCLQTNGVLLIVTPDSNHASAHSALMKEWNLALIRIGFVRFKLEKLKFLYCMAFRKTCASHIEKYLEMKRYQCCFEPKIAIPQDTVDYAQSHLYTKDVT